jgi:nitroimidazol reductase NimA-like FMN-containing flavoprotein (pyridoxamine 5'-phosphate oxidase superfamily)
MWLTVEVGTGHSLEIISEAECWRLLGEHTVGRLAISIANRPDIFPVNYVLDDGTVVIKTAPGLKLAAASLGAGVAFEVDAFNETEHVGWSVVVSGAAFEVDEDDERIRIESLGIAPWASGPKSRYLRVVPDQVTGRRIPG